MIMNIKTEQNDVIKDNMIEMKYITSRSDLSDLNCGLSLLLDSLGENTMKFDLFVRDFRNALSILGVVSNTPISKEVSSMIIERLFDKLNPILHDLATIYVKLDGE